MSIKLSNDKILEHKNDHNQWDRAIRSAEEELRSAEVQVLRLRSAIRTFRENKKLEVNWPETSKINEIDTDLS